MMKNGGVTAHMDHERERVGAAMGRINDAWLGKRVDDLAALIHDGIVTALPGFAGRITGRGAFLAGFRDFCENATIHEFRAEEYQIDAVADTAVVTFSYVMVYERSGERYRVTGRDLWVFGRGDGTWLAVWRTMLDLSEAPA